jgi:hypothetical protein
VEDNSIIITQAVHQIKHVVASDLLSGFRKIDFTE